MDVAHAAVAVAARETVLSFLLLQIHRDHGIIKVVISSIKSQTCSLESLMVSLTIILLNTCIVTKMGLIAVPLPMPSVTTSTL